MPPLPTSSLPLTTHCDSVSLCPDQSLKTIASLASPLKCPSIPSQTLHCKVPIATSISVLLVEVLKLMLLLVLYNVRSERELMDTLGERLDWLWFLDFDLDTEIPNHSVLSKARKRWGEEAFRGFYERVVWQCTETSSAQVVESGLVGGSKIFVYSSLI